MPNRRHYSALYFVKVIMPGMVKLYNIVIATKTNLLSILINIQSIIIYKQQVKSKVLSQLINWNLGI